MENEQLVTLIQNGADEAENMLQLWRQTYLFIHMLAGRFCAYAEREDLEQEGYIGLCAAVQHYDADMGVPFINYASFWIKQRMQAYIENCCHSLHLPNTLQRALRKYKKAVSSYQKQYGKVPDDREIMGLLEIDKAEFEKIKKAAVMEQVQSLDAPTGEDEESGSLADMIPSADRMDEDCAQRLDREKLCGVIREDMERLPEEQRTILYFHYQEGKPIRECAELIGSTVSRAYGIEKKALSTLRFSRKSGVYRSYYEEYLQCVSQYVSVASFQRTGISAVEREVLRRVEES